VCEREGGFKVGRGGGRGRGREGDGRWGGKCERGGGGREREMRCSGKKKIR